MFLWRFSLLFNRFLYLCSKDGPDSEVPTHHASSHCTKRSLSVASLPIITLLYSNPLLRAPACSEVFVKDSNNEKRQVVKVI